MTIYDIARIAGVNASTVSRVINGKPGVSQKKREEILAVLKEYNFIPDETARNLVTQKTGMIGILTDDLKSTHMNEAISVIQHELLENGYHCYVSYVNGTGSEAIEQGIRDMASRKVEGIMLLGVLFHNHALLEPEIDKYFRDKPVVLVNQTARTKHENMYVVGASEDNGIRRCVELLAEKNRKNLMMLIDQGRTSTNKLKKTFADTAAQILPGASVQVITDLPVNGTEGEKIAGKIVREHPDIDGLMCTHDRIAINMMYALQDAGRKVPEDVSVIGEDNSELCKVCRPKLTSMDTMIRETTLLSAKTMLSVLGGETMKPYVSLEMEIVERDSL